MPNNARGQSIVPVILAGGRGRPLWPASRACCPKQFQPLFGKKSLFQHAVEKADALDFAHPPIVLASLECREVVEQQLQRSGVDSEALVYEPGPRNIAAAVTLAALIAEARNPGAVLLVLPTDQSLADSGSFQAALDSAIRACKLCQLAIFGSTNASSAHSAKYIRTGEALPEGAGFEFETLVDDRREPDFDLFDPQALTLEASGVLLLPVDLYLQEMRCLEPDLVTTCLQTLSLATVADDIYVPDAKTYAAAKDVCLDRALLERTWKSAAVTLEPWGPHIDSWQPMWEMAENVPCDNAVSGDILLHDVENAYVRIDGILTAVIGLRDIVVVSSEDAILVALKDRLRDVAKLVDHLSTMRRDETRNQRLVQRPWGSYESIDQGETYQVKRITVNPGERLSLQYHHHRSEHWTVVSGSALVTLNDDVLTMKANGNIFIPVGATHRLENIGDEPLVLIEVQYGSYLGEDDIVRLEDAYGRAA